MNAVEQPFHSHAHEQNRCHDGVVRLTLQSSRRILLDAGEVTSTEFPQIYVAYGMKP
jgi:hypothetical protein